MTEPEGSWKMTSTTGLALVTALLLTACATGMPEVPDRAPGRTESRQSLPNAMLGTYISRGNFYGQFGELVLEANTLSWGSCQSVQYQIFRNVADTYYIELDQTSPCTFLGSRYPYVILIKRDEGLEVALCPERDEYDKGGQHRCAVGIVRKTK